jgi:hypothetical protein
MKKSVLTELIREVIKEETSAETNTEEQTVYIKYYKEVNAIIASVGGKKVGALRVKPYQDGYQVDSVIVNPDYRNFGIGKEMYRVAFENLKILYSDKHQTPDAKRVWDSLIKSGEAVKTDQRYKMVKALEESYSLQDIIAEILQEEKKGLWYYINRKHKLGKKAARKGSKAFKLAVKAGKEILATTEGVDDPVQPGILKDRLGKLTCTKVRTAHSALGNKGTHYGKALQRYLNYHCQ